MALVSPMVVVSVVGFVDSHSIDSRSMNLMHCFIRATASEVSIFYVLYDGVIVFCIINSIARDADTLVRGQFGTN